MDASSEEAGGVDPSSNEIVPMGEGEVKAETPGGAMTVTRASGSYDTKEDSKTADMPLAAKRLSRTLRT